MSVKCVMKFVIQRDKYTFFAVCVSMKFKWGTTKEKKQSYKNKFQVCKSVFSNVFSNQS